LGCDIRARQDKSRIVGAAKGASSNAFSATANPFAKKTEKA
jgi:hypothetical protein